MSATILPSFMVIDGPPQNRGIGFDGSGLGRFLKSISTQFPSLAGVSLGPLFATVSA
jgi:hypothetical protein